MTSPSRRFKNLEEVLDFYSNGNFFTNNFDKSIEKTTGLTPAEKLDLLVFLRTLTDRTFLYDRRFIDPGMAKQE